MAITIKDVAREAGVSIATVSHVINGTRYVKPELTEKVLGKSGEEARHCQIGRKIRYSGRNPKCRRLPVYQNNHMYHPAVRVQGILCFHLPDL